MFAKIKTYSKKANIEYTVDLIKENKNTDSIEWFFFHSGLSCGN